MPDDKTILTVALEEAARADWALTPSPTLLGPGPDQSVIDRLVAAIENCAAYQAVAGHMVFSGGSRPVLQSGGLADRLFFQKARDGMAT